MENLQAKTYETESGWKAKVQLPGETMYFSGEKEEIVIYKLRVYVNGFLKHGLDE